MDAEGHGAGVEYEAAVGVSCNIVKELGHRGVCPLGGCDLLRANGTKYHQEFVVDGPVIIQQGANN